MSSKFIFFLILVVLIVGISIFGYFKAIPGVENQTENLPKIEIRPKVYDFGEIKFGDVVNYSFLVKNLGNEVLEIKRVATSCACATAKIAKEKINPGEETELLVTYDSGSMPLHGSGREERIIYLRSNDPLYPQAEVKIYATVK